ncbi:DUF6817 domain-containing protein [Pseudonocardia spinosispora]|uniref:DUF6817 domain-containing protein n=1 Tax=Pseudonocardia spinosispora TaxID=103441 RepID=UPI0004276E2C|nr:hypothetical protein [Pseudonocardia spinosispora]
MENRLRAVEELLLDRRADTVPHPGGTLLDHLRRVRLLLAEWGAGPTVQLAGLGHAFYGTDGFAVGLLDLPERPRLAAIAGEDAEALIYLYASCDRAATYPRLASGESLFTDRFTGLSSTPDPAALRAFMEITAANEMDVTQHNQAIAEAHGPALKGLIRNTRQHLSAQALQAWGVG